MLEMTLIQENFANELKVKGYVNKSDLEVGFNFSVRF